MKRKGPLPQPSGKGVKVTGVCVCVRVCVCLSVCMHVCIYMSVYMYVRMCVCACKHMSVLGVGGIPVYT